MMNGKGKCKDCWSHPKCRRNDVVIRSSSSPKEDGCARSVETITSKGEVDATVVGNRRRNGEWETGFVNSVEI